MLRNCILITFLIAIKTTFIAGQNPPASCDFPDPNTYFNNISSIPMITCPQLEVKMQLGGPGFPYGQGNVSVDNPHMFTFIPAGESIEITSQITSPFSLPFHRGYQIFIFQASVLNSCNSWNPQNFMNAFSSFPGGFYNFFTPEPVHNEVINLNPCELYFLVFDGNAGSTVDLLIDIYGLDSPVSKELNFSNVTISGSTAQILLNGSMNMSSGNSCSLPALFYDYLIEDCIHLCGCSTSSGGCDILSPFVITDLSYPETWEVELIIAGQNNASVEITNIDQSGEICITYQVDDCEKVICQYIEFSRDSIYFCKGDTVEWNGILITDEGEYWSSNAFDIHIVDAIFHGEINFEESSLVICHSSSWTDPDGQLIYDPGTYRYEIFPEGNICPNIYTFHIDFIDAPNLVKNGDIGCMGHSVELSLEIPDNYHPSAYAITWLDPNEQVIATNTTQITAATPGNYSVSLIYEASEEQCVFDLDITVEEVIDLDFSVQHYDTQLCTGQSANLQFTTDGDIITIYQGTTLIEELTDGFWNSPPLVENTCYIVVVESELSPHCVLEEVLCTEVSPVYQMPPVNASLCAGDTYTWEGTQYDTPGQYEVVYPSVDGCDSILTLNLNAIPADTTDLYVTACESSPYLFLDTELYLTGTYEFSIQNSNGCDSLVFVHLEVYPVDKIFDTLYICMGDSLRIDGQIYFAPAEITLTYLNQYECDSLVHLTLRNFPEIETEVEVIHTCTSEDLGYIEIKILNDNGNFTFDWDPQVSSSNSASGLSPGIYFITITNEHDCSITLQIEVEAFECKQIPIIADPETCPGMNDGTITLGHKLADFKYKLNDVELPENAYTWENLTPGIYTYEQFHIEENETTKINLLIREGQEPDFYVPEEIFIPNRNQWFDIPAQSELAVNILSAFWEPEDIYNDPFAIFPAVSIIASTKSTVFVKSITQCEISFTFDLILPEIIQIYSPNSFSPNNDGTNDFWRMYTENDADYTVYLSIYNRWGTEVYQCKNCTPEQAQWNGTFNGELCNPDIYIFRAEITKGDLLEKSISGDFMLKL